MSKPWRITIDVDTGDTSTKTTLEFPYRPTEDELGLKLAQFFDRMNFRFDEHLKGIRECILLSPRRRHDEDSPD